MLVVLNYHHVHLWKGREKQYFVIYAKTFFFLCSHQWTEVATNQHQELIVKSLLAARDAFLEMRLHMREMGVAAVVPVRLPL